MIPEIGLVSGLSPGQSVICIVGDGSVPDFLALSESEKEYALRMLSGKEEYVYINSYYRIIYLIPFRNGLPDYKSKEELRKSASGLKKLIRSNDHKELVITSSDVPAGSVEAFTEGLILSFYSFDKYKTKKEEKNYPGKILLVSDAGESELKWLRSVCTSVYKTRDLINEPPNHLNATDLAREIRSIGSKSGFTVDVLNKGKIEALKMGGLLAVNRGSIDPPVFCILEWNPPDRVNDKPVVLIGKGVMYDTGGLNIKTGDYMAQMKADMAGAATVAGAMSIIASTSVPLHVVGLIPATDNRPGGNAFTQGDILTMFNGSTVEVGNTDAEGRLILADAISYAGKFEPELIIDIATLTGSAAVTFGNKAIAVMGNAGKHYFELLEEAGNEVFERVASLPFWEEYSELLKSDIADIKNIGGREAGAITAGKFLESFTTHPFIHLDIAGSGILKEDDFYRIKEGPGSGLRLLATFFRKLASQHHNS